MHSQGSTALFDSPKSIFGFEPINGATPGGHQLQTQRSLLAELLQASAEGPELAEEHEEEDDDCATRSLALSALRPNCCTCNVGQGVPRHLHARQCALTNICDATTTFGAEEETVPAVTLPIYIPQKTYYKTSKQIEERQRLQYQRQVYRMQLEAHEQALAAGRP